MPTLMKSSRKASSRRQIDIKGVKDNVLLLPNNQYRIVLEASSLNFELKSEAEQDALIDTYESFLNSLPCPLQVLVRIRELDMSKYLADLEAKYSAEDEQVYKDQLQNYSEFVRDLVEDNKILSRRFYIVLPYGSKEDDFETAKERLILNADLVMKGLARMGMQTRQLPSLEILDLFHAFYNPAHAKTQPISDSIIHSLNNTYVRKEQI